MGHFTKSSRQQKTPPCCHGGVFAKSGDNLLSRCSHYHRPRLLNGRVRNGNGCGQLGMVTGNTLGSTIDNYQFTIANWQTRSFDCQLSIVNCRYVFQLAAVRVALCMEPSSRHSQGHSCGRQICNLKSQICNRLGRQGSMRSSVWLLVPVS